MTVWLLSMLIAPATAVRAIHSGRPTLRDIHGNYTWPNSAEEWKAEMPEQHLIHKYLKTGAVVLEVGGNIGRATIVAAESVGPNGRIYSSEANEEEKRKQRERCKPLIDADRVRLIPPISDIPLYQQGWFTNTEKATPARLAYTGMKAEDWRENKEGQLHIFEEKDSTGCCISQVDGEGTPVPEPEKRVDLYGPSTSFPLKLT